MSGIDTSIYRIAPSDPLNGISNALSVANAAKQNQILGTQSDMLQSQYGAQQAIGNAFSGAIDPNTGVYSPNGANLAIRANPAAAYGAPAAIQQNVGIQGGQISNQGGLIANTTGQSNLNQAQMEQSIARANAIAAAGGGRKEIMQSLNTDLANASLNPQSFHNLVVNLPPDDKGARKYIATRAAGTVSAPAQASPVVAGYDPVSLQPVVKTSAALNAAAALPTGTITAPAPGTVEVATKDKTQMQEDQLLSGRRMADLRPLQSALPLISQLSNANFGPGSAEFAKIKGALTTAGIINPNTSDLQVRQEANKYLLQYANGAQAAGRSDAALSSALGSNPNLDLTQPANLALVKTQIARDRMDAAIPQAYSAEAKPGQSYTDFKSGYYQQHDPRAFQIDTMTPQERAAVQKSLGPKGSPAYDKFVKSYNLAKQAGMLQPGQGQ